MLSFLNAQTVTPNNGYLIESSNLFASSHSVSMHVQNLPHRQDQTASHPDAITPSKNTPSNHPEPTTFPEPMAAALLSPVGNGSFAPPSLVFISALPPYPFPTFVNVTTVVHGSRTLVSPCTSAAVPLGMRLTVVPSTVIAAPPGVSVVPGATT